MFFMHRSIAEARTGARRRLSAWPTGRGRRSCTAVLTGAALMLAAAGAPAAAEQAAVELSFTDAAHLSTANKAYIDTAQKVDLMIGDAEGTFRADAGLRRAETAIVVVRTLGLESAAVQFRLLPVL